MSVFQRVKAYYVKKKVEAALNQFYSLEKGDSLGSLTACINLLNAVPITEFHQYHPRAGESKTVVTGIRNLDAFVKILQRADTTLRSKLVFKDDWYDEYERHYNTSGGLASSHYFAPKTIDSLLVTSTGQYISPAMTIARMIVHGITICSFLKEGLENNSPYEKTSLIVLNRMVTDLMNLSVAFIEMTFDY
jgi:hypothetical protein